MGVKWKQFMESPSAWVIKGGLSLLLFGLIWVGTVFAENTSFRIENLKTIDRIENEVKEIKKDVKELLKRKEK